MPNCMADDDKAAVFVGTFLGNGQSVAVCDEHLVMFCASTLHTMTGLDPMPFIAAISEDELPGEAPVEPSEPAEPELDPEPGVSMKGRYYPTEKGLQALAEPEPAADPTPPTRSRGHMRAVSSGPPTADGSEPDTTTADAAAATPAG